LFLLEFFGRWPDFLITRRCPDPVLFLRFSSPSSSLRQFPVLVQESVFGSYTQESATDLRSPHQFGFAGDFFLVPVAISSARFLCFQLGPKRAVPRAPSVSPRFCPLKLFARPYLATAGLLCLYCFISSFVSQRIHVTRFDSDFRPRLLGLRAKGQSSHWIFAAGGLVPAVACSSQILLWLQTSVGCS
jgi:hypothetical protein